MAVSIFDYKAVMPNNNMVATALGDTYSIWDELQNHVKAEYPDVTGEWKHYGKAAGWSFKLISKKRNLLFFIPLQGCFRIRISLGEKAVASAETVELPKEIKDSIHTATPYVEGSSIDINVNCRKQLETIKKLLKIKFEK